MENPSYHLQSVVRDRNEMQDFEGPLSLILLLLQKNKIEIRDVKIAELCDQYLAWLEEMERMDLDVASEFVQMASHLLYLKTRSLLTVEGEPSELELLLASLEQLKSRDAFAAVQQVTPALKAASERGFLYYTKLPEPLPKAEYDYRHEPVDLLRALAQIYGRGGHTPDRERIEQAVPSRIVYSVYDKSREILGKLRRGKMDLRDLYGSCRSRSELVATFLSVLELCSMGSVALTRKGETWFVRFTGGDVEEILERIEET